MNTYNKLALLQCPDHYDVAHIANDMDYNNSSTYLESFN